MKKRVFLIVLDSVGIGELPDAENWGDKGSNTLNAIRNHPNFNWDWNIISCKADWIKDTGFVKP